MRLGSLFLFLAIFYCSDSYSQIKNEDELKKQAEKDFEDEEYEKAYAYYSQLVSLYPKDPEYNYRLGVCMLFTEPDKKKPYSYLQLATKNPADAPKDALFYLAKTYHINYKFDEAIKLYTEFKKIGSASSVKKLQVDREIQACKNGKRLLSNLTDLVIISKKQLNEIDYFKAYDTKDIGGKILVKPDDYKSGYDKKKKDKSVVYLPRKAERLYYSSYGENGGNGRDIYYVNKLPNGSWSKPTILPSSVNTEFDEDYPFLHPNGKTLYFSSKGHNSMGGYDVFKTTFDETTQLWSKPENLEFPVNSPDDDILFVTDSLEKTAFFSTGRYSPYGKIDVLKVNTERRPMNFAVIKGTVVKEEAAQSVKSKITVKNMANGEIVGTFQAQDNGDYNMELPNGGKFIFTVETPGIPTQSDGVQIPVAYTLKPYKQVISYENKILKIINYFDGAVTDDNYSMMIDLIEKKAKLEVNENDPYNNSLIKDASKNQTSGDETKNLNSVSTNNPTVQGTEENQKTNTNKNVTNEQLLEIAKTDAKEASEEATKLKQEAQDAFGLATQKTAESVEKQKQADEALANANTITDATKKNEELTKANQLKEDAKIASGVANTATNMAKKLEVDANIQQKEADLTNQYISQLETVIKNKNNKEALTKLEDIQKELDDLSKQKNQSDELLASLKAEAVLKQQELTNSEKKNNSITNEISAIKTETESLEKDLANENDKSIKENISAQIRELNNEIGLKEKELLTNNQKIETLKNEVDGVNQEIQIASKILNGKTDDIATNESSNNESSSAANNTSGSDSEKKSTASLSYAELKNKYDPSLNSNTINKTNKEEVAQQNDILKTYNQEVNSLISLNKNTLAKTSNPTEKKKLNEEIKNLEKLKTENENLIASNNLIIKQQENSSVANNETNPNETTSLESITNKYNLQIKTVNADNASREEITQQIDILKAYNQEIDALIEANKNALTKTTKVPDQEKLNEEIKNLENRKIDNDNLITANINSIKQIENNTQISNNVNANGSNTNSVVLTNEAEILNNQAYELRKEAAGKTGEEKEAILRQAIEKENLSIEKKLTASVIAQKQNQAVFDNNTTNLTELQKLTGEKTSDEISQANMLADEAALNFKQAQKMRTEAEAYPSGSAKLGGLSNAEEKENEAIAKQKAALAILSKNNPGYKMKPLTNSDQNLSSTSNTNTQSNQVKEQIKSYTELSKGNQEDIKSASDIVSKNPAFNDPSNKQAQDLKLKADQLSNEAQTLINQAETTNTDEEKARILTQANAKEREALKALSEANEVLKNNNNNSSIVTNNEANNSTPENNISTENNNANNTARVNNNNSTENQNESSSVSTNSVTPTNTVATNTNNETVNNEDSNPVNNPNTDNNNSSNNQKDGNIGAEVSQLKSGLNNPNESALVNFNNYNSTEAINLKNKATEKINTALKEDKQISSDLDNVNQLAVNNSGGSVISKQTITALISEADQLNDQAFALRKASATKTADEKEKDINNAKTLEANAISKKIEAASKQQQLNNATYDANKQSLEELAQLAKGKNIAELNNAETLSNEAGLFLKQAGKLREEANAYPSDGAKLGGYSNAEEKEAQAIEKQQALLDIYKKHFPDYVPKKAAITDDNPEALSKLNNTKANLNTNNQTHIEGLQLLSQANEIEYKNRFAGLSENLNSTQIDLKTKAQNSYKNNEDLINQANQSSDLVTKKNLLVEANKSGQEAINLLNQISNPESVVANNSGNNINNSTPTATNTVNQTANKNGNAANNSNATNNTTTNNTNSQKTNNNNTTTNNVNVVKIKVEGLEVKNTNAYSADRPIPLDEKIQDGLVFKVQIGAFKTVLPNNTFKGLSPVIAQTTPNGYIRYMAGNFEQYSSANAVKNDLRNLGYSDAFVVAYYNGVRISLNEATDKAKAAGQTIDPTTNTSAGITANTNVPRNVITPSATSNNSNDTQPAEIANELEKMNGLLYTVQIGVYSKQVTKSQLSNLRPIYTEQLPNGLYRYTAGIYNQTDKLIEDKRKVVELGVKDAFISSYYNAKRIPFAEGKKLQAENNNLKMEAQNPIIFSGELATTNNAGSNTTATNTITTTPIANAFSNGVTSGPAPTPENGVKTDESGISYKVQIGAYKNQVPNDIASKFLNIKTWPVQNVVINGLFIYTIGNFTSATFAKKLKDEAISLGITDAYITVYKDGKKLYGAEATTYLNN